MKQYKKNLNVNDNPGLKIHADKNYEKYTQREITQCTDK